jgi:hypothetical protein
MPSLEDFRTKVALNADAAFKDYVLHIDEMSLDYAPGANGQLIAAEFKPSLMVVFEFSEPNIITMRAKRDTDEGGREISYLPWKNASDGGMAQARLTGGGPPYFSTSQLTGCRFTIQYDDGSRKTVTVQHLAGDVQGGKKPEGSATRDSIETRNLPTGSDLQLRHRYSIGQMKPLQFKQLNLASGITLYYDGGKAAIFGYRNKGGVWVFYASEEKFDSGVGLRNLGTGFAVTTSINVNANR